MISFKTYIEEARKNPELNPKTPIGEIIGRYLLKSKKIPNTSIENAFVSFTEIDKLGINPLSNYNTPLGIYAYPAQYVLDVGGYSNMDDLPFAGDSEFVNLFRIKGNIIDLNFFTENDLQRYISKIKTVLAKKQNLKVGTAEYDIMENVVDTVVDESRFRAKNDFPEGRFWYITLELTAYFSKDKNVSFRQRLTKTNPSGKKKFIHTKPYSIQWNKFLRSLDIDGIYDDGEGIIHSNEPTQIVILNPRSIKDKERHYNKYHPDVIQKGKNIKQSVENIKQMDLATKVKKLFFPEMVFNNSLIFKLTKELPKKAIDHFMDFIYAGKKLNPSDMHFLIKEKMIADFFKSFSKNNIEETAIRFIFMLNIFSKAKNPNLTFELVHSIYNEINNPTQKESIKHFVDMVFNDTTLTYWLPKPIEEVPKEYRSTKMYYNG